MSVVDDVQVDTDTAQRVCVNMRDWQFDMVIEESRRFPLPLTNATRRLTRPILEHIEEVFRESDFCRLLIRYYNIK